MVMFNSKQTKLAAGTGWDPAKDMEYQRIVGGAAYGESADKRNGVIDVASAPNMWDNNIQNWSAGNYPKLEDTETGLRSAPHADFKEKLESPLPDDGEVYPGIKHYDSGRHFDIHVFHHPDGNGGTRQKVAVYAGNVNVHGNHIYDIESGKWHHKDETHESPDAVDSYNPLDVVRSAPADFADTTRSWISPPPSLAFCPTCHRFPKNQSNQLEIFQPTECTVCGETGRDAKYDYEPAMFTEGAESSAMRQSVAGICDNPSCSNYKKNITTQPAYIDNTFDVIHPGDEGAQERKIWQFTPDTLEHHKGDLAFRDSYAEPGEDPRFPEGGLSHQLRKAWSAAYDMGDLSENEEYKAATRAVQRNQQIISDLRVQTNPANHEFIDEIPEAYKGSNAIPYRTVYDNEEFSRKIQDGKLTSVQLPMRAMACDHSDCDNHSGIVCQDPKCTASHTGIIPSQIQQHPNVILPCQHCGRDHRSGADVVNDVSGYVRCNPIEYGANTCAPVPGHVSDPEAYLGWFKPDPKFKFPKAKIDDKTGAGVLMQPFGGGINDSEGNYPGQQSTRVRNPLGGFPLRGHGVEGYNSTIKFGKGHRAWAFLGMAGRKVAKPFVRGVGDKERIQQNKLTLRDEAIGPDEYKRIINTPFIGTGDPDNFDYGNVLSGIVGDDGGPDIDFSDFLPGVSAPINTKAAATKRTVATNRFGETVHPDLYQDEYNEVFGDPKAVPSVGRFMKFFRRKFAEHRGTYPVDLEPINKRKASKGIIGLYKTAAEGKIKLPGPGGGFMSGIDPSNFDSQSTYDVNAVPWTRPETFLPDSEEEEYTNDENAQNVPQVESCPVCDGDSRFNKPKFFKWARGSAGVHCKSCTSEECGSDVSNPDPHCKGCKKSKKGCKGRKRFFWNNHKETCSGCENHEALSNDTEMVCPKCNNSGSIIINRKHCADCNRSGCRGSSTAGSIHCDGCPDHAKEQRGELHDATPGRHVSDPITVSEEHSPEAISALNKEIKSSLLINPEDEGISEDEDPFILEKARQEMLEQRERDLQEGFAVTETPLETAADQLRQYGPAVMLSRTPRSKNKKLNESLALDVEKLSQERQSFMGQNAAFDSPAAIGRLRRQVEKADEDDVMMDDQDDPETRFPTPAETGVVNEGPVAHIVHDVNCPLCDRGIVRPDRVGPEEMKRINGLIGEGTARIKRTVSDPNEQRAQIAQLAADANKCRGVDGNG